MAVLFLEGIYSVKRASVFFAEPELASSNSQCLNGNWATRVFAASFNMWRVKQRWRTELTCRCNRTSHSRRWRKNSWGSFRFVSVVINCEKRVSISNSWTVPMPRHACGLHAETDGRAQQARAATSERRPPADRNRRLGRRRGRGLRRRTDGRSGTSKAGQTWQTDGPNRAEIALFLARMN